MFNRFNRFNQFNKRNMYTNPSPNNPLKTPQEQDLYSGVMSGILAVMFGTSLYVDKKSEYTENEKVSRHMASGLTALTGAYSVLHLIKYLKK